MTNFLLINLMICIIILQLTLSRSLPSSVQEYKHMAEELLLEHEEKKPNPVIQRVKIIMVIF